jgi:hypothetical protein
MLTPYVKFDSWRAFCSSVRVSVSQSLLSVADFVQQLEIFSLGLCLPLSLIQPYSIVNGHGGLASIVATPQATGADPQQPSPAPPPAAANSALPPAADSPGTSGRYTQTAAHTASIVPC